MPKGYYLFDENNCSSLMILDCNRNEECTSCTNESNIGTNCTDECFNCLGGCDINGKCLNDKYCIDDTFYGDGCDFRHF